MLLAKQYVSRWPLRLGLATMLVLLVFAWHFYLERSAYTDLAYHVFIYLKTNALFVQNRRFVAIVTQWPTLLTLRAGWSLDHVLQFYSVVFVSYYLAVFLACAHWFRNQQVALVVALLFVLLASRTFYWAQSELPQSLAALLLFYGGVARQAPLQFKFSTLALAALVPVFIFGHPLCVLPFVFLWAYDWLLNRRFRDWPYYGLLVLALALYKLRVALVPPGSYEAAHMTFGINLEHYYPYYLTLPSFANFWHLCAHDFLALSILMVALTVFYIGQLDRWATLRLLLVWGFVAGYTFIVNVANPENTEITYLENLYLPLTLFVAVPFALELLPALEQRRAGRGMRPALVLLALTLVVRLGVVWQRHTPYTAYQQWLHQLLAYTGQFPERKFMMRVDNLDPFSLRAGRPWWASASETMLLSARHSPDSVQSVRFTDDDKLNYLMSEGAAPGQLLGPFEKINTADLPATYCRFPASTSYRLLNTPAPADTADLRRYIAARQGVQLALAEALPTTLRTGRSYPARVQVTVPPAQRPLHSSGQGPHPTLLQVAFYKPDGWPTDVAPVAVPLEVDVWQPWTQTMMMQVPHQLGHYILEISLVSRDYRAWPVRLRMPVEVVH